MFPHSDQPFLIICFAPQFVDSSHLVDKKQVTHTVAVGISPMICDAQTYITCLFPYLWRGVSINPFPICVVLIFFVVLRIKPWAVHIRGKHWTVRHQATSPGELAWFWICLHVLVLTFRRLLYILYYNNSLLDIRVVNVPSHSLRILETVFVCTAADLGHVEVSNLHEVHLLFFLLCLWLCCSLKKPPADTKIQDFS